MAQTPNFGPNAKANATGFNAFAAGDKMYGTQTSPNLGPTAAKEGYGERDKTISARKGAIMRRLNNQRNNNVGANSLISVPGSGPLGV